jgi:asparagine synthase (glutamine-hydrolysing)
VVTGVEVAREFDRILWAMDQPTVDGVNTYFVAKTAREAGLTVALSGLGGDELFGGYREVFRGVPWVMRGVRLVHGVPGSRAMVLAGARRLSRAARWTRVVEALERPPSAPSAYLACRGLFPAAEVRSLVEPEVWQGAAETFDPMKWIVDRVGDAGQLFSWVSRAELLTYTHDQLLRDTDAMSMAHSIEVRVPLLDHRLVEAVLRLPSCVKRTGGRPKGLLLKAVGDLLPPSVRDRREKQGFVLPFQQWLRGPLWQVVLEEDACGGMLRRSALNRVRCSWEAGKLHWSRLWAIVVLQAWLRAHVSTA